MPSLPNLPTRSRRDTPLYGIQAATKMTISWGLISLPTILMSLSFVFRLVELETKTTTMKVFGKTLPNGLCLNLLLLVISVSTQSQNWDRACLISIVPVPVSLTRVVIIPTRDKQCGY